MQPYEINILFRLKYKTVHVYIVITKKNKKSNDMYDSKNPMTSDDIAIVENWRLIDSRENHRVRVSSCNSRILHRCSCIYFGWNAATNTQKNSTDNKNMNIVSLSFSIFDLFSNLLSPICTCRNNLEQKLNFHIEKTKMKTSNKLMGLWHVCRLRHTDPIKKNASQNFQRNPNEKNFHRAKFCYQLNIYASPQNSLNHAALKLITLFSLLSERVRAM